MHAGVENAGVEIVGEEKIMESERFDNLLLNASTEKIANVANRSDEKFQWQPLLCDR